jgi:hypothetical protein
VQSPFSAANPSQVAERMNRLGSARFFIFVGLKSFGILGASMSDLLGEKLAGDVKFLDGE